MVIPIISPVIASEVWCRPIDLKIFGLFTRALARLDRFCARLDLQAEVEAGPLSSQPLFGRILRKGFHMGDKKLPRSIDSCILDIFADNVEPGKNIYLPSSETPEGIPVAGSNCQAVVIAASTLFSSDPPKYG